MAARVRARVTDGDPVDHIRAKHLLAITSNRLSLVKRFKPRRLFKTQDLLCALRGFQPSVQFSKISSNGAIHSLRNNRDKGVVQRSFEAVIACVAVWQQQAGSGDCYSSAWRSGCCGICINTSLNARRQRGNWHCSQPRKWYVSERALRQS